MRARKKTQVSQPSPSNTSLEEEVICSWLDFVSHFRECSSIQNLSRRKRLFVKQRPQALWGTMVARAYHTVQGEVFLSVKC